MKIHSEINEEPFFQASSGIKRQLSRDSLVARLYLLRYQECQLLFRDLEVVGDLQV